MYNLQYVRAINKNADYEREFGHNASVFHKSLGQFTLIQDEAKRFGQARVFKA